MFKSRKPSTWLIMALIVHCLILGTVAACVIVIDPYMHYHAPLKSLSYTLSEDDERMVNDGIIRHMDYDAVITGSSMCENFRTSEADRIFGMHFVKIPFAGASYYETAQYLTKALYYQPQLKMTIDCLDMYRYDNEPDEMRLDMGDYPTYLYNSNPFDDAEYLFNKDVMERCLLMFRQKEAGGTGGMTSFDDYGNWMEDGYTFGADSVLEGISSFDPPSEKHHMTQEDAAKVRANIQSNIVELSKENPDTQFCYFLPPYSAVWWGSIWSSGDLERQLEEERIMIELLLPYSNVHLYSWNTDIDMTANLDNYKDDLHYGSWINTKILTWIHDGTGLLTQENYQEYLEQEEQIYSTYDYNSLFDEVPLE